MGHRVVHGGERFKEAALVDDSVLASVEEYASMAPLHNLANLKGITTAQAAYPDLPHVIVFDTSFFPTNAKTCLYVCTTQGLVRAARRA